MRTSTLLVLLGLSIIAVSLATFASFILNNGTTGPLIAPAGSVLSIAVLLGLGQIIVGRALRPSAAETERSDKREKQKSAQQSLSKSRSRTEEEAPRIIAVDDQEPSAWLKTTLEKLAEQGSEHEEEGVVPAELSREPPVSSKPRPEERARPLPIPQPKVRGTLVNTPPEYTRLTPKRESAYEQRPETREELEPKPESIPLLSTETPTVTPPSPHREEPEEESRPGVRRLKEMEITFVERDGITFLEPGTGIHERYPCDDQTLIDYAWRALVRGLKVNAEVDGGKVSKLTPAT